MQLEKYADGIIEIKRSEKAIPLRAALWSKIGDREMYERHAREITGQGKSEQLRTRASMEGFESKM
jgi:hypothetical protein